MAKTIEELIAENNMAKKVEKLIGELKSWNRRMKISLKICEEGHKEYLRLRGCASFTTK